MGTTGQQFSLRSLLGRAIILLAGASLMLGGMGVVAPDAAGASGSDTTSVTDIPNPDSYTCSQAGFVGFESLPDGTTLPDTIAGLNFVTTGGNTWRVGDFATGNYNGKYPQGAYMSEGTHWAWLGPNFGSGRIDMSSGPATYISLLTSVGGTGVYLEAYDASGNLLASAGPAPYTLNTGHMTELKITRASPDIAYVMVHDTGNFFVVDSICTDAPGVSEPNGVPTISSVTPDWAPFKGGTTVTIKGANFGATPSVVFTDNCTLSAFFRKPATVISASPTQIVVSVPSAESPTASSGLYNVASMDGPACLEVYGPGGGGSTSFNYVVPEIGQLVFHNGSPQPDGPYAQCTAEAVQSGNHRVVLTAGHCVVGSDDFAFAPGYFGPLCPTAPSGSSSAFSCGTAPYGIWCAKSTLASDPGCGNTSGTTKVMPNFGSNSHTEDFGYIVTTPKNGVTLGQKIGGGLTITFGVGAHADQSWNIFGYKDGYLDTCYAPTVFDFGNEAAAVLQIANGGDPACSFVVGGASGGAWINGGNGALYGIGAVNDTAPTPTNPQGLGTGAYMGRDAQALWNSVQNLP